MQIFTVIDICGGQWRSFKFSAEQYLQKISLSTLYAAKGYKLRCWFRLNPPAFRFTIEGLWLLCLSNMMQKLPSTCSQAPFTFKEVQHPFLAILVIVMHNKISLRYTIISFGILSWQINHAKKSAMMQVRGGGRTQFSWS